jgi:hypothetical protein
VNGTPGTFKCQEKELTNGDKTSVVTISDVSRVNEVLISIPPHLVDAVIAGWVLLVHRYQRDAFHSFTWGFKRSEEEFSHTISASDLDLLNIRTVADLLQAVQKVKPDGTPNENPTGSVFILNDGTANEVKWTYHAQGDRLNILIVDVPSNS